ncbi:6-phosphogluconolactonase [Novosphingobium sp. JCM 18896]|uniref:6-phosphogluconolactonase n=1 Tax=Novosphingobium sp. JCM 18896 TaxID=2989731 RepID=UPI002221FF32|nr:6-phosphogluconolactonase [Novosphingobium sp. JCM 18896]MCW1430318.1 6-phosphogluconolactonase [Novosphingobium sp. JCM 18896]
MAEIEIIADASDVEIATWLLERLEAALTLDPGEIAISVPGGSTPFPILAELAHAPLDWSRIAVWPGDDRMVEESHAASNVGRIRALLEPAGARIVPLAENAEPPHFALVWLGMGGDGHVASLFPNTDPRADDPARLRRLTPDPLPPEAPFDRLSLTLPALLDSDRLLFVIRGADKRALFEEAGAGGNDLPVARLLAAARQPVTCFT